MGKGDKKSKRGKIIMGSYGVKRKRNSTKAVILPVSKPKEKPAAKTREVIEPKTADAIHVVSEVEIDPKELKAPKESKETKEPKAKTPAKKKTTVKTTKKSTTKEDLPLADEPQKTEE